MATFPRCLCLVLTLWMVASGPSATVQSGSPISRWWGTKESVQIQDGVRRQIQAGNYSAVEKLFREYRTAAARAGDRVGVLRCLSGEGSARMARYDYGGALASYLEAKEMASATRDVVDLAAVDANLSSLYLQIFDADSSLRAGDEALAALREANSVYYTPQLLLQIGRLHFAAGEKDAEALFRNGIRAAEIARRKSPNQNFEAVEAQGWDLLGDNRLARHDLSGAEQAYLEALGLRRRAAPRDLGYSYARTGSLRLEQAAMQADAGRKEALLSEAASDTEMALKEQAAGAPGEPLYQLRYQRGRVLLAEGKTVDALQELETAVSLAQRWRAGIPYTFSSLEGATAELNEHISSAFIRAAADYGIAAHDARWVRESFQAAEFDRVLGLQESQTLAQIWRRKLPIEFWETLAELRAEDAAMLRAGHRKSALADSLRLRLTEMETQAGVGLDRNNGENFPTSDSLTHFQKRLRNSELLLSFELEPSGSYLWAVTRDSLSAYHLPPQRQIAEAVEGFRQAIESGGGSAADLGRQLYRMLLGQLRPQEAAKRVWLLSPDDAIFELPFAALVPEEHGRDSEDFPAGLEGRSGVVYLAELHSLEVVPGAFETGGIAPAQAEKQGRFLGVGDPIYNVADPRWTGPRRANPGQFNRLPGSGREILTSAEAWTGDNPAARITLEGFQARREEFLNRISPGLAVIHLATHVVTPPETPGQAFIAFGLNESGQTELLPSAEVALLRTPGTVVVMTGCDTAQGNPLPGVGLRGLTRAWSIAGASAVVATLWPVEDSGGGFFTSFYSRLRNSTVAEALRASQIAMIRSGTASSAPSAWAAYQVFGGAQ